ncbi:YceI family protein [Flavobacteriales bacterium]|jgi:polyisoprenoid-binding protein YceI|nr:YceI family protein [Flavobacteriales bacterium]
MKHYSIALVAAFFLIQPFISVAQNSSINVQSSSVEWAAGKIVGGDHNGTIEINKGSLVLEDDRIVSGSVALDMTTMANSDLSPEYGAKLMGHLKSPDFFDVASHPMATLVINEASKFKKNKATIKANATIKGITKPLEFEVTRSGKAFDATIEIDRSQFDVRYGSNSFFDNLGDQAIRDIFVMTVHLEVK